MSDYQLRLQAAERGENKYEGKPCKVDPAHGATRYTSNSRCVQCTRAATDERQGRIRALLKKSAA